MKIGRLQIDDLAEEIQERARSGAEPEVEAKTRGDRLRELFIRAAVAAGFDEEEVREGTAPGYEAQGTIDSRVVIRTFERDTVASLLPRGLELAPQPVVHHTRHPVLFLFSVDHFDAWFGDMDYREMMVAIPYVQRTDLHIPHRGPFIYMPRLYLDDKLPRRFGNLLYGFEKLDGVIEQDDRSYAVRELDGDEVVRLTYESAGTEQLPHELPNFESVRRLFDMPTVSQGARIYDDDAWSERESEGFFICSNVRYDFDDPDATIQPIRATLVVDAELAPRGLRTDAFESESIADAELGAFRMKVKQTVSLPGSCSDVHFPIAKPRRRKKVVVLGGGAAACTAAFYLAQQPERYEVELYTQGWRLGGKCAAARGTSGSERIEEHGLHAFVGFYDNVFRTMREVYETAGMPLAVGDPPYDHDKGEGPVAAAFSGTLGVGLMDRHAGQWHYFETGQRFDGRLPGAIPTSEADELPGVGQVLLAVIERIRLEIDNMRAKVDSSTALVSERQSRENTWWRRLLAWIREVLGLEPRVSELAGLLDKFTDYQQQIFTEFLGNMVVRRSPVVRGLAEVFRGLRAILKQTFADDIDRDRSVWFTWSNLDLVLTVAVGIIESGTVNADDLDHRDFREWLVEHGLDPRNVNIAAVTMVYNTLFSNERDEEGQGSNPAKPDNLACGVALRWFLLLGFGYKGYPAYDFHWSCPQTVFSPMYEALRKLGVNVHFFHEVTGLQVEGTQEESRRLTGIQIRQQARVKAGSASYDPFLKEGARRDPATGQRAWPREPNWEQLDDDDAATLREREIDLENAWSGWEGVAERTLTQGVDFDVCVLGIPLGALREIARPLYDPKCPTASPEWTNMMTKIGVTPTASFQLWFDAPWERLYSGPHRALLTGFAQPWPSLGDFTHVIEWEGWPIGNTPKYLAYHTGAMLPGHPLDDHPAHEREYPQMQQRKTADKIKRWLRTHYAGVYDKFESWDDFLATLNAPEGLEGESRLDAQYFHASFQPSDLYILSQAGTTKHRLGQGESGYRNLFLCGDWTRTSLNSGCVEGATQSGMLAARVISNKPSFVWSPGF
ncbi:MAG: FAD-dependent oxidoreductase [Myxococcota bacterium]